MTRKIWAFKYVVTLLVFLSLIIIACGGSSGEDEGKQPVSVSVQTGAQNQNEASSSEDVQEASGEQDSGQSSVDESAVESGGETSAITPTSADDIQAMQIIMVVENLDTGETMEASYSFVKPDRFQTNIMAMETLTVGGTAYLRDPQGQWVEQAAFPASLTEQAVEQVASAFTELATIYELLDDPSDSGLTQMSEEEINGVNTLVYTYSGGLTSPLIGVISGEVKVWIGQTDGLLYRQEVVNATDTGLGPRTRGIVEIVYGDAVSIEGPK
jgi:hypothetical protein